MRIVPALGWLESGIEWLARGWGALVILMVLNFRSSINSMAGSGNSDARLNYAHPGSPFSVNKRKPTPQIAQLLADLRIRIRLAWGWGVYKGSSGWHPAGGFYTQPPVPQPEGFDTAQAAVIGMYTDNSAVFLPAPLELGIRMRKLSWSS